MSVDWRPPSPDRLTHLPAGALEPVLKRLLECPASLLPKLASQTHEALRQTEAGSMTFSELLQVARKCVDEPRWPLEDLKRLVGGHPRIGAPLTPGTGNVSEESRQEQLRGGGADPATLARLERLNDLYEQRYPGLAFVTHVAGRPRSAVADELQNLLGPEVTAHSVSSSSFPAQLVVPEGSPDWCNELERGYDALWRIAHDRAGKMQAQMDGASKL